MNFPTHFSFLNLSCALFKKKHLKSQFRHFWIYFHEIYFLAEVLCDKNKLSSLSKSSCLFLSVNYLVISIKQTSLNIIVHSEKIKNNFTRALNYICRNILSYYELKN